MIWYRLLAAGGKIRMRQIPGAAGHGWLVPGWRVPGWPRGEWVIWGWGGVRCLSTENFKKNLYAH